MISPLLDWASQYPWLATALSFPTAMVLVVASWMAAEVASRGINLVIQLATLASNTFILIVRGYAPQSREANPEDDDQPPSATT